MKAAFREVRAHAVGEFREVVMVGQIGFVVLPAVEVPFIVGDKQCVRIGHASYD
jgi:hypothetical protein